MYVYPTAENKTLNFVNFRREQTKRQKNEIKSPNLGMHTQFFDFTFSFHCH